VGESLFEEASSFRADGMVGDGEMTSGRNEAAISGVDVALA
jgi:hypothetical protein